MNISDDVQCCDEVMQIFDSANSFVGRFGLSRDIDSSTLQSRVDVLLEEVRELEEEIAGEGQADEAAVAAAAIDVLYASIVTVIRLRPDIRTQGVLSTIQKNDLKSLASHHLGPHGKVVQKG